MCVWMRQNNMWIAVIRLFRNYFKLLLLQSPFGLQTIAGLWDVEKRVTLVLGEVDVVRVNPYRSDQGTSSALGMVRTSTAVAQFRGPIPGLPLTRCYNVHQARIT